jgi:hypothetical protein
MNYFGKYFDRIRNTKKLAKEHSVPVWEIPLVNAVGLVILCSVYLGVFSWDAISKLSFDYNPSWFVFLENNAVWLPVIYFAALSLTTLDKFLICLIRIQALITKSIFNAITKADHKIWRKTGKDSFIANKIWWMQQKWMGLDKKQRRRVIGVLIFFAMIYYALKFAWV